MSETKEDVEKNEVRHPDLFISELKKSVEEFAPGVSLQEFNSIVKTLNDEPKVAKKAYEKLKFFLIEELHEDIDFMREEMNFDENYNKITKLISAVTHSNTAWRPKTGDCDSQLNVYIKKGLQEKRRKLVQLLEQQNKRYQSAVQKLQAFRVLFEKQSKFISVIESNVTDTLEFYTETYDKLEKSMKNLEEFK